MPRPMMTLLKIMLRMGKYLLIKDERERKMSVEIEETL